MTKYTANTYKPCRKKGESVLFFCRALSLPYKILLELVKLYYNTSCCLKDHTPCSNDFYTIVENYVIAQPWRHWHPGNSASTTSSSLPNPLGQQHWAVNYHKTPERQIPQDHPIFHNIHLQVMMGTTDRDGTPRSAGHKCVNMCVYRCMKKNTAHNAHTKILSVYIKTALRSKWYCF